MTIHNEAKKNEIAKVVLMPGDPLRAKWIAENFLTKYRLVNKVRGMYAYTGFYKNKKITIMAHGMGQPSIGIYSYELFKFYDVQTIIRIGSCGSYVKQAPIGSVIVCKEVFSESIYAKELGIDVPKNKILKASQSILNSFIETANILNKDIIVGKIHSSDCFYGHQSWQQASKLSKNLLGVDMESFALYANAIKLKKNALCVVTVSDSFIAKQKMSPLERQTTLRSMIELSLETAIKII